MAMEALSIPSSPALEARRGEGVAVILQNNEDQSVTVGLLNPALETMLGYAPGEALGKPVIEILGQQEALLIRDDLEYNEHAPDFGDLFSRIANVRLKRRTGEEIQVNCTLSRLMAQGKSACFQLLVPNEYERTSQQKLQEFIRLNLDGRKEIDPATGLPDGNTARAFLPLLKSYFTENASNVVFAVVQLDRFEKSLQRYGKDACAQLLLQAHQCCRSTFRSADLIFALSDRALGVVLFDISRESARVVLNRLRWKIRSQRFAFGGKPDFSISTSVGFDVLDLESPLKAFEHCSREIEKIDANERNMLLELNIS